MSLVFTPTVAKTRIRNTAGYRNYTPSATGFVAPAVPPSASSVPRNGLEELKD